MYDGKWKMEKHRAKSNVILIISLSCNRCQIPDAGLKRVEARLVRRSLKDEDGWKM